MNKTTWRKELIKALADNGESWSDMISCTLTKRELDVEFSPTDCNVEEFVLWTANHAYFNAFSRGAGRLVDSLSLVSARSESKRQAA